MADMTVTLGARVPGADPDAVFARLRDFPGYTRHTDVVKDVVITEERDGVQLSDWSVYFRTGLLRWTERDVIDTAARTIVFSQVHGDFAVLEGGWAVLADPVTVRFRTRFDIGIPSLAAMLNPVAARALTANTTAILRGLFGDGIEITP
ncbi:MAG TPA: SRPBCC family protein [Thermomonospora sp.]|nr:SRPBCC family protein [Thermomonospora sp.]